MKFIGVDLGWQSGPSGLCCLERIGNSLVLSQLDRVDTLEAVLAWVASVAPSPLPAMVAVDAPTIIPNNTGMRSPDRLAHKYFGKYHAGCYPANLGRPFAARLVQFGKDLESQGFAHAPTVTPQQLGRYQVEVFPHIAMIQLFSLSRILKYKKGRLAERVKRLTELKHYILTRLTQHEPPLVVKQLPDIPVTGKELKALEDQLDSIICAYAGAYWWYWGLARNGVMGSVAEGYIVVSSPPGAPVSCADCL